MKYLGKDSNGDDYYQDPDAYVYQYRDGVCLGWLCSGPAWGRTFYKILKKRS